jgi:hypothetical protein
VRLLFAFDLQPMLDAPQETIGTLEIERFLPRQQIEFSERR